MSQIKITFPDKSVKEYAKSVTPGDIAEQLGGKIAKYAIAAEVNDNLVDLSFPIENDATMRLLTIADKESSGIVLLM